MLHQTSAQSNRSATERIKFASASSALADKLWDAGCNRLGQGLHSGGLGRTAAQRVRRVHRVGRWRPRAEPLAAPAARTPSSTDWPGAPAPAVLTQDKVGCRRALTIPPLPATAGAPPAIKPAKQDAVGVINQRMTP